MNKALARYLKYESAILLITPTVVFATETAADTDSNLATATFAGGCFWCMEEALDKVDGVTSTISGYIGGHVKDPTYKQVSAGGTGHTEAVQIRYDPAIVSYSRLLEVFWRNIDPTVNDRQFCDRGDQYRPAIFFYNDDQQRLSKASKEALLDSKSFDGPILTEISMASAFYPAEEYHQNFYMKNPIRYNVYKFNCGRTKRLKTLWGD